MLSKVKRMKYSVSFKLQAVKFASDSSNNSAASRKFGIDGKVSPRLEKEDWQHKVLCRKPNVQIVAGSASGLSLRKRSSNGSRKTERVGSPWQEIWSVCTPKKTAQQMNIDNFLVWSGWCTRFMKRNKLVLHQKTKISQRLPDDLEEKITSFQSFVIRARRSKNYSLVNIGNMDETPVWFDMPTFKTVDSIGTKTVLLKTTGHEKTHFTVVLACLADGTKLKPMVIFKRKTMPKDNFPRWRSGT